jgi:hypothetical protein
MEKIHELGGKVEPLKEQAKEKALTMKDEAKEMVRHGVTDICERMFVYLIQPFSASDSRRLAPKKISQKAAALMKSTPMSSALPRNRSTTSRRTL